MADAICIVAAYVRPAELAYMLTERLINGLKAFSLPECPPLIIAGDFNARLDRSETVMQTLVIG